MTLPDSADLAGVTLTLTSSTDWTPDGSQARSHTTQGRGALPSRKVLLPPHLAARGRQGTPRGFSPGNQRFHHS